MNSTLLKKEEKEEEEEEPAEENSERGAEDRRNIPLRKVVTAPHKKRKWCVQSRRLSDVSQTVLTRFLQRKQPNIK